MQTCEFCENSEMIHHPTDINSLSCTPSSDEPCETIEIEDDDKKKEEKKKEEK